MMASTALCMQCLTQNCMNGVCGHHWHRIVTQMPAIENISICFDGKASHLMLTLAGSTLLARYCGLQESTFNLAIVLRALHNRTGSCMMVLVATVAAEASSRKHLKHQGDLLGPSGLQPITPGRYGDSNDVLDVNATRVVTHVCRTSEFPDFQHVSYAEPRR